MPFNIDVNDKYIFKISDKYLQLNMFVQMHKLDLKNEDTQKMSHILYQIIWPTFISDGI